MYHSHRELCFYCGYGLAEGLVYLWIMGQPVGMKWLIGVVAVGSLFVRGLARRERRKRRRETEKIEMVIEE